MPDYLTQSRIEGMLFTSVEICSALLERPIDLPHATYFGKIR